MITQNQSQTDQLELPCAHKIAFDTRRQARAAANIANYHYGNRLVTYLCQYCLLWHLATDYGDED